MGAPSSLTYGAVPSGSSADVAEKGEAPRTPTLREARWSKGKSLTVAVFCLMIMLCLYWLVGSTTGWRKQTASPDGFGTSSYTIIAACKLSHDRRPMFRQALRSWLDLPRDVVDHIVIVDWGSSHDLRDSALRVVNQKAAETANASHPMRVDILEMSETPPPGADSVWNSTDVPWKLSSAYNLGFFLGGVRSKYVAKLDCDTHLASDFFSHNDLERHPPGDFLTAGWRHARDANDVHLNGILLASSHDFRAVNGYDERIFEYGWDDEDLYERLTAVAPNGEAAHEQMLRDKNGRSLITHLWHRRKRDEDRGGSTCTNREGVRALSRSAPWNGQRRTTYRISGFRKGEVKVKETGDEVFVTTVEATSWVPDLRDTLRGEEWARVEALCAAERLAEIPSERATTETQSAQVL